MPREPAKRRHLIFWLLAAGVVVLTGCGVTPRTDAESGAKKAWQSERTPQELNQLRNRLMTSQTDR